MGSTGETAGAGRHRVPGSGTRGRRVPSLMACALLSGVVLLPGACAPASAAPTAVRGGAATAPVTSSPDGGTVCDTRPMVIPTVGPAAPYGAAISVPAVPGRIASLSVELRGLSAAALQDLDVLLVGPDGTKRATVLSDAGPAQRTSTGALDLTFSDDALLPAPTGPLAGLMPPGSYRPTDDTSAGPDTYPAPAVTDATASTPAPADLGIFAGASTAGTWTLYVVDDEAGDPDDPASSTPGALGAWCLTFHQVASTVTELAGPSAIVVSQQVSYRATVRSDSARVPGGRVVFRDGSKELGRSAVGADGIATLVTTAVGVGTRTITARYRGTGIWQDSTSAGLTTKVLPAATDLGLTATTLGGADHRKVRLKASVDSRAPATAAITGGEVDFFSGGRKISNGTVSASGEVSTEVEAGADPGTVSYRAEYRGNSTFAASTATAEAEVPKIATKVRGTVVTDNPTSGAPVTVSVTISESRSGHAPVTAGTARLLIDGVASGAEGVPDRTGEVSLTVDSLRAGSRRLTVDYRGTDTWAPSSVSGTVRVDRAGSSTVVLAAPSPSTYGSPVTLIATVEAGGQDLSSGAVTFSDGGTTLGTTGVRNGTAVLTLDRPGPGIHHFVAEFSGTDDVRRSSGATDHQVQQVATTAELVLDADRIRPDRGAVATLRVSSPIGDVPDGLVTLSVDGRTVLEPRPIGADGTVRLELLPLPVGSHRIQAAYSGSERFAPSGSGADLMVEPITVVVDVDIAPAAPRVGRSAVFRASVREPDGTPVTAGRMEFTLDGTPTAIADLDGAGIAQISRPLLAAHRLQIRARYLPDADHAPAEAQMMADISKAVASLRIVAPGAATTYPGTPSIQATVSAAGIRVGGGSVVLSSDGVPLGAPVALDENGRAMIRVPILSAGRHTVTAEFSGTDDVGTVSARWDQIVDRAPTTVTSLVSPGDAVLDGSPVAVSATIRRAGGGAGAVGRAQVRIDDRPVGTPVRIGPDGRVLLDAGALPIGTHRIQVAYLPDGDHLASTGAARAIAVIPRIAAGGPYLLEEGSTLRLVAGPHSAGTDIGWDLDGDAVADVRGADVVLSWEELTRYGVDDGPSAHPITAIATRNGQTSTATGRIEVSNAAPRADVSLLRGAAAGDPVTVQIAAADASPVDDDATLRIRIRWDADGPWSQASGIIDGPQSGRWTHTYRSAGEYEPLVEVTDKDGAATLVSAGRVTVRAIPTTPALRPEQVRPTTDVPKPTRAAPAATGRTEPAAAPPGTASLAATSRAAAAEQPRRVASVTALAVPLPAVAVPVDERTLSRSTGTAPIRSTPADGVAADIDLAADSAVPDAPDPPFPAGAVALLLLLAAALVGGMVRRHRLARPHS